MLTLAVVLESGLLGPIRARADDQIRDARVELGRVWYQKYCTPCHGPGGTPGSAAYPDTKQPVDLRNYVQRYGGQFPTDRWISVVFHPLSGGTHTEVVERIRSTRPTGAEGDVEADGVVAIIADYIISIQAK